MTPFTDVSTPLTTEVRSTFLYCGAAFTPSVSTQITTDFFEVSELPAVAPPSPPATGKITSTPSARSS